MNCEELKSNICAYFEDGLEPRVRAAMERHLQGCAACTRYLALNRETSCRDLADFLSEYIEGHLPIAQRVVFESHLAACPPCVDYMRSLERTIEAGRQACQGEVAIPEPLVQAILKARKQV